MIFRSTVGEPLLVRFKFYGASILCVQAAYILFRCIEAIPERISILTLAASAFCLFISLNYLRHYPNEDLRRRKLKILEQYTRVLPKELRSSYGKSAPYSARQVTASIKRLRLSTEYVAWAVVLFSSRESFAKSKLRDKYDFTEINNDIVNLSPYINTAFDNGHDMNYGGDGSSTHHSDHH